MIIKFKGSDYMKVQTNTQENNTQPPVIKKRGRPPRDSVPTRVQSTTQLEAIHINESENESKDYTVNTPDFKTLMSTINALKQQNEKLLHIVETVNITTTKPLITCSDEDINDLYVKYLTDKETVLNNVVVAEVDGKILITKSYFEIG
jgi:hypothetical protein